MKAKDIRSMDAGRREQELEGLLREQFNLRMQNGSKQQPLANNARIKQVRRDIARIKTIINEDAKAAKGETA